MTIHLKGCILSIGDDPHTHIYFRKDKVLKMKRTFTRTTFNPDLSKAKVTLYVFPECKYRPNNNTEENETKVEYTGLTSWDVIEGGEEAEEIEESGLVDEFHEYLVLHFNNNTTATFRNSHVDMFIR